MQTQALSLNLLTVLRFSHPKSDIWFIWYGTCKPLKAPLGPRYKVASEEEGMSQNEKKTRRHQVVVVEYHLVSLQVGMGPNGSETEGYLGACCLSDLTGSDSSRPTS